MRRRTKNANRPNTYIHMQSWAEQSEGNTLRKSNHEWQLVTTAAAEIWYTAQPKSIQHPVKRNRNNNNYGCNYNSCVYVTLKPHAHSIRIQLLSHLHFSIRGISLAPTDRPIHWVSRHRFIFSFFFSVFNDISPHTFSVRTMCRLAAICCCFLSSIYIFSSSSSSSSSS